MSFSGAIEHYTMQGFLDEAEMLLQRPPYPQQSQELIDLYTQAIAACPDTSVEPYVALAYFAYRGQLYTEALLFLKQAMKIEPFHQPTQALYRQIKALTEGTVHHKG